jgi:rhamnogalacturonyl hydrolase YesR
MKDNIVLMENERPESIHDEASDFWMKNKEVEISRQRRGSRYWHKDNFPIFLWDDTKYVNSKDYFKDFIK